MREGGMTAGRDDAGRRSGAVFEDGLSRNFVRCRWVVLRGGQAVGSYLT